MSTENAYSQTLSEYQRRWQRSGLIVCAVLAVVCAALYHVKLFDGARLAQGVPSIVSLVGEMLPPNFSDAKNWLWPVLDTLMMSVAGTALAVLFSLPLSLFAAANTAPHPLVYQISRGILNGLRSIPARYGVPASIRRMKRAIGIAPPSGGRSRAIASSKSPATSTCGLSLARAKTAQ